jgi:hypothetical protein
VPARLPAQKARQQGYSGGLPQQGSGRAVRGVPAERQLVLFAMIHPPVGQPLRGGFGRSHKAVLFRSIVPSPSASLRAGFCKRSKAGAASIMMMAAKLGQPPVRGTHPCKRRKDGAAHFVVVHGKQRAVEWSIYKVRYHDGSVFTVLWFGLSATCRWQRSTSREEAKSGFSRTCFFLEQCLARLVIFLERWLFPLNRKEQVKAPILFVVTDGPALVPNP